jgi:hypothetical protein
MQLDSFDRQTDGEGPLELFNARLPALLAEAQNIDL